MSSTEIGTKLSTARYIAMYIAPYFSSALYRILPVCVPLGTLSEQGTMGMTANGTMFYEEVAIRRWSEQQVAAVFIHELMHWLRNHAGRCGDRDPKLWNYAADMEINDDLLAMKLDLPDKPVIPDTLNLPRGLLAEEYYEKLPKEPEKREPDIGHGRCGRCAGNGNEPQDQPGKDKDGNDNKTGQLHGAAAPLVRKQVAEQVQSQAAKGRGHVPAGLERWAKAMLKPPVIPWETRLARACRNACTDRPGAVDFSFSYPSRRQAGIGYGPGKPVLPGLMEPIPNVAVGLDTSGSMGTKEVEAGLTETNHILKALNASITFLSCDSDVHAIGKAASMRDIAKLVKGGGGTDFRPVFAAIRKIKPRPEVLVFITDGCGPAPKFPPPGLHVIWLLVGPYKSKPYTCEDGDGYDNSGPVTYGTFIEMNDAGQKEET